MSRLILPRDIAHEVTRVLTHATVEKRDERYDEARRLYLGRGLTAYEAERRAAFEIVPFEVIEGDYNAMVDAGINLALALLIGGGGTAFNAANAYLGVGSSTTAWATGQTALQTQLARVGMKATYPTTGTKQVSFASDFSGATGDGAWQEWGVFNAAAAGTMLNRKVESLGTKSGGTWTLTATFSFA